MEIFPQIKEPLDEAFQQVSSELVERAEQSGRLLPQLGPLLIDLLKRRQKLNSLLPLKPRSLAKASKSIATFYQT